MENMSTGNNQPQINSDVEHQPHSVPYLEIGRGYIVFKGLNYVEVENVLIEPQENPPL
jgi:hypothetical protein